MTTTGKVSLAVLFLVFILLPGIIHYVRSHEQMRLALYKDAQTIAQLQSENARELSLIQKLQGGKASGQKTLDMADFCVPA